MARGKEAVQAANRRAASAEARADQWRTQLESERMECHRRVLDLEAEVRRLRAEHLAEASRLADKEIRRRTEEVAEQRRQRGLSDDIAGNLVLQKDRFIMNAVRYVSMTTGKHPVDAIGMVTTWCTDKDFYGVTDRVDFLLELGVPEDGWVATAWKHVDARKERKTAYSRMQKNRPEAITLDRAEAEDHPDIHPNYQAAWFGEGPLATRNFVSTNQPEPVKLLKPIKARRIVVEGRRR